MIKLMRRRSSPLLREILADRYRTAQFRAEAAAPPPQQDPDILMEQGVGLIAQGMWRKAQIDRVDACNAGMAAVSTIRELAFGFVRVVKKEAESA